MRPILIALILLGLTRHDAAPASTPAALLCVKQAQTDLKACQSLTRQTGDACTTSYFDAVPPCFGTNAPCASECIAARTGCVTQPRDERAACAAACDEQSRTLQAGCKRRPVRDARVCSLTARLKSLKCKQKCARAAAIPLQRCGLDFNGCLRTCATEGGS